LDASRTNRRRTPTATEGAAGRRHAQGGAGARGTRGEVRIIAGEWRRRRITFPSLEGLRPTPDRVRETLFNWLGQDLAGWRCLDLFAGSGALGFEALSRGAARVVMVERDARACEALRANARVLGGEKGIDERWELRGGDALEFLRRQGAHSPGGYDLVLLDPPFDAGVPSGLLELLPPLLAKHASVYVESGTGFEAPAPWTVYRQARAGQVHFQLMRWEAAW